MCTIFHLKDMSGVKVVSIDAERSWGWIFFLYYLSKRVDGYILRDAAPPADNSTCTFDNMV